MKAFLFTVVLYLCRNYSHSKAYKGALGQTCAEPATGISNVNICRLMKTLFLHCVVVISCTKCHQYVLELEYTNWRLVILTLVQVR